MRRTYCDIDPDVVDRWGIPVLRFHWQWGENEMKMAEDMQETFRAIIEAAGGTVLGGGGPAQSRTFQRVARSSMNWAP